MAVIFFSSCSIPFGAYLRNLTNETAVVHVFIINKQYLNRLPDRVDVANEIVKFKSGLRRKFSDQQPVKWIDTAHFIFHLKPQSSADLTDMGARFINGSPNNYIRVIVKTTSKSDTLLNGYGDFYRRKFIYTHYGLSNPTYYYDVQ